MIRRSIPALFALSLLADVAGVAAVAAQAQATDQTRSARVVYADLDLASPAGRHTLSNRLSGAVDRVCVNAGTLLEQGICRSTARDRARTDLHAAGVPTL